MADILVVDDDEADRVKLAAMLEPRGHTVHLAENGDDAVAIFLERPVQLVVTDIAMPHGSGVSLIACIRAVRSDVPIIAVSGKGTDGLAAAHSSGAATVLVKPVAHSDLIAAVALGLAGDRE